MPTPVPWSLTVAGVDRTAYVRKRTLNWQFTRGNRGTLSCLLQDSISDNTAYRPDVDQEVVLTINGTAVFGGFITTCEDAPLGGMRGGTGTRITVGSYEMLYDRVGVTQTFPTGSTLHDIVNWIVTHVLNPSFGITLDGTMLPGGTFNGPMVYDGTQPVSAIWAQLTTATGWVTRTSAAKVLSWFAPGTVSSPISLTSANCTTPIQWQKKRDQYANRIIIQYGPSSPLVVNDTVTGDGVTTSFALTYTPATDPASGFIVSQGYVNDPAGSTSYLPIGAYGVDPTVWTWNAADNTLHRTSALGLGVQASFNYTAPFPQTVIVQDSADIASKGPWEARISLPQTTNKTTATQIGTGALARAKQAPRRLQAATTAGQSLPGDTLTLSFPHRTVSGTWMVDTVKGQLYGPGVFRYDYEFLEGTNPQATWADYLRQLTSGQATAATSTIVAGSYSAPAMVILSSPTYMGGSWNQSIPNAGSKQLIPAATPYIAAASFSARLRFNLKSRGGNAVHVVISDGTTDTASASRSSTAFGDDSLLVSIQAGHTYWVYAKYDSTPDEPYVGYASLEAA